MAKITLLRFFNAHFPIVLLFFLWKNRSTEIVGQTVSGLLPKNITVCYRELSFWPWQALGWQRVLDVKEHLSLQSRVQGFKSF